MATPLRYQSQYVPTNFQAVGQLTNLLARDMATRDASFDAAVAAESAALENIGAMPVEAINLGERNKRLQDLQNRIGEIVGKRGGDYGAAAKDISRAIALERSDPFYEMARQQQEQAKAYRGLQQRYGADFYATADPTRVSYEQYMQDPTALEFNYANLANLDQLAAAKAKEKATERGNFINQRIEGLMREVGYDYGQASQQAAAEWMQQNPEFIGDIMQSYNIDDPTVRQRLEQAALSQMVGERDTRFTQDYEATIDAKRTLTTQPDVPQFNAYQDLDVKYTTDKIKDNINTLRGGIKNGKMDSSTIQAKDNMFDPFMEGVVFDFMNEMQYIGESAWNLGLNILNMEDSEKEHSKYWEQGPKGARQQRQINKYEVLKDAYEKKYPNIKKSSKNDADFLNKVEQLEVANSVIKGTELSLGDPSLAKNLFVAVKEVPHRKSKAKTFVNKETGKSISRKEAEDRLGSAPLQIRVNSEGMLTVAIPNKGEDRYEDYIINPESLPVGISKSEDNKSIKEISDIFNRYNLTNKEISEINNSVYRLDSSPYFYRVSINPQNPLEKRFTKIIGKDETGNFVEEPATLSELQYLNTINTFKNIKQE